MDIELTRSGWPLRKRPEPTRLTAPDAMTSVQDPSRSTASSAVLPTSGEAAKGAEDVALVQAPEASPAIRTPGREDPVSAPEPTERDRDRDVPEDVEPLMERLAPSIRALVESDQLNEENKRALVQALTQFESAVRRSSEDPKEVIEAVDAKKRHERLEAAIDEFHASLKQIFRIGDDKASERVPDASRDAFTSASAAEASGLADVFPPAAEENQQPGEVLSDRERLLLRIQAAYDPPASGAQDAEQRSAPQPSSDAKGLDGTAYARFVSMYTALYPTPDRVPSLNEEG